MPATLRRFQIQSGFAQVEEKPNVTPRVLPGVSLMSVGEAKGHEDEEGRKVYVDDETLRQIFGCIANDMGGSVKFKMDHGSGVLATEGWFSNIRLNGSEKLVGDLNFYESTDEKIVTKIFEIARKNPTHLGISLEFAGPDVPQSDKRALARCTEVFTAALVSDPAANKSLFEKKVVALPEKYCMSQPNEKKTMADEIKDPSIKPEVKDSAPDTMPAWATAMCQKFDDSMAGQAALMKRFDEIQPPATKKDEQPAAPPAEKKDAKPDGSDGKPDKDKEMSARDKTLVETTVREMAAKLGLRVSAPGVHAEKKEEDGKSYAALVEAKELELTTAGDKSPKVNAQLFCMKAHKKEYAAARLVSPKQ